MTYREMIEQLQTKYADQLDKPVVVCDCYDTPAVYINSVMLEPAARDYRDNDASGDAEDDNPPKVRGGDLMICFMG